MSKVVANLTQLPARFTDGKGKVVIWEIVFYTLSIGALAYSIVSSRKNIAKTKLEIEEQKKKAVNVALVEHRLAEIEKKLGIANPSLKT